MGEAQQTQLWEQVTGATRAVYASRAMGVHLHTKIKSLPVCRACLLRVFAQACALNLSVDRQISAPTRMQRFEMDVTVTAARLSNTAFGT